MPSWFQFVLLLIALPDLLLAQIVFPPSIQNATLQGNSFRLSFSSAEAQVYIMQATADLAPPVTWKSLAAVDGMGVITDPDATAPSRYYRLKVILPNSAELFSVNTVGYVRQVMQTGTNLLANPLNTRETPTIGSLLPNCPDGSTIFKTTGSQNWSVFSDGAWEPATLTLSPGDGAIFVNPAAPFVVSFVGEVPQGTLNNVLMPGTMLKSSIAPVNGLLSFPAQEGDSIQTWDITNRSFVTHEFNGGWDTLPAIHPGEAFWVTVAAPTLWVQNFFVSGFGEVEAPFIYRHPASRENDPDTTATFTVATTGTAPLAYQWKFNGTNLADGGNVSGAATATLVLGNVQANQAGVYSVVVSNALAVAVSSNATLTVIAPPPSTTGGNVVAWGDNFSGQATVSAGLSNVVAVAAGGSHSLALRADGTVATWGDNSYGQTAVPARVTNVVSVAAGGGHSLALRADGSVGAWGNNNFGQTTVPAGLSNVVSVAAGGSHSLALRADGSVTAWGNSHSGQTTVPAGLSNVVAVAAGGSHSLALRADGTVAAWGDNSYGQIAVPAGVTNVVAVAAGGSHSLALRADGTVAAWGQYYKDTGFVPMTVPLGVNNVVAVAAGGGHSLALRADGTVAAWGAYQVGQTSVPAGLSSVVAVAAGGGYSLALVGLPGGLAAPQVVGSHFLIGTVDRPFHYRIMALNSPTSYGASGLPQGITLNPSTGLITGQSSQAGTYAVVLSARNASGIGQGKVTLVVNLPLPSVVGRVVGTLGIPLSYTLVTINAPVSFAASGLPAGLVIHPSTGVISGAPLELGDFPVSVIVSNRYGVGSGFVRIWVSSVAAWGSNYYDQTSVPVALSNVVAVAAGGRHSLALRADGTVTAWGQYLNQTNTIKCCDVPAIVPVGLSNVIAVAAGGEHSLALRADGTIIAWGDNWENQATVPAGLSNVVAVAAGANYSLALRADGTVAAWGQYYNGSRSVAMTVPAGLSNVVAVAAGWQHSLALRADGTVTAWGRNSSGLTTVPAGLSNVVSVAAGDQLSLALRSNGTVVNWGDYAWELPVGLSNVVAVAALGPHSLALRADGSIAAWGNNNFGQTTVPAGLSNVVAVAAGANYSLALISAVTDPVEIVRQPRSEAVLSGTNVSLYVLARGRPPLRYQWRFNGTDIPGATHAAYSITNAQSDPLGEYSVVVSNASGSVTSEVAQLTGYHDDGSPAAWEGTDDFSSGISAANWTIKQMNTGLMTARGTNGHVSFLVPSSTTDSQNAYIVWNGTPTVAEDWTVEITGHNGANWSANGSSQFQFDFFDTTTIQTSLRGYGFSMARGRHGSSKPQVRLGTSFAERTNTPAPSPDFAMRLIYSSTSKNVEAWWDENGNGSSWTRLDTINLEDVSPGMGAIATNSFTFAILGNCYYGPISEGQLWADNFRVTGSAPLPPPLVVAGAQRSVGFEFLHLTWTNNGSPCVLESAGALTGGWSTVTTLWTTNAGWVSTTVSNSSPAQFYRLRGN